MTTMKRAALDWCNLNRVRSTQGTTPQRHDTVIHGAIYVAKGDRTKDKTRPIWTKDPTKTTKITFTTETTYEAHILIRSMSSLISVEDLLKAINSHQPELIRGALTQLKKTELSNNCLSVWIMVLDRAISCYVVAMAVKLFHDCLKELLKILHTSNPESTLPYHPHLISSFRARHICFIIKQSQILINSLSLQNSAVSPMELKQVMIAWNRSEREKCEKCAIADNEQALTNLLDDWSAAKEEPAAMAEEHRSLGFEVFCLVNAHLLAVGSLGVVKMLHPALSVFLKRHTSREPMGLMDKCAIRSIASAVSQILMEDVVEHLQGSKAVTRTDAELETCRQLLAHLNTIPDSELDVLSWFAGSGHGEPCFSRAVLLAQMCLSWRHLSADRKASIPTSPINCPDKLADLMLGNDDELIDTLLLSAAFQAASPESSHNIHALFGAVMSRLSWDTDIIVDWLISHDASARVLLFFIKLLKIPVCKDFSCTKPKTSVRRPANPLTAKTPNQHSSPNQAASGSDPVSCPAKKRQRTESDFKSLDSNYAVRLRIHENAHGFPSTRNLQLGLQATDSQAIQIPSKSYSYRREFRLLMLNLRQRLSDLASKGLVSFNPAPLIRLIDRCEF